MLTFEFKQDTEFSNPYYDVVYEDGCIFATLVFHDGDWWVRFSDDFDIRSLILEEIASKLTELDASLRAQRNWWFK